MVLTKEAIDTVQLTRRFGRSYDAREVDALLDAIAAAADEQRKELEHLRSVQAEHAQMMNKIAETLVFAQQTAAEMTEKTRMKCNAELAALQQRKNALLQEVASLERYKLNEVEKIRNDLDKLLERDKVDWVLPRTVI
jgi:DivIVA domain-containing protein